MTRTLIATLLTTTALALGACAGLVSVVVSLVGVLLLLR